MKLKIPPAIQLVISVFAMYLIMKLEETARFSFDTQKIVSLIVFAIAVVLGLIAVFGFKKQKTSVNPLNPEKVTTLIVTGVYKYTRNPMYLAILIGLISVAIMFGSYYSFIIIPLFVWYITVFQIIPEEEVLNKKFKKEYSDYCKKVRRWV